MAKKKGKEKPKDSQVEAKDVEVSGEKGDIVEKDDRRLLSEDGVIPRPKEGESLADYVRDELVKYKNEDGSPVTFSDVLNNARIVGELTSDTNFQRLVDEHNGTVPKAMPDQAPAKEGSDPGGLAVGGNKEEMRNDPPIIDDAIPVPNDDTGGSSVVNDARSAVNLSIAPRLHDLDLTVHISYTSDRRATMYDLGRGVSDLTDGGTFTYTYDEYSLHDLVANILRPGVIKGKLEINGDFCTVQVIDKDPRHDAARMVRYLASRRGPYVIRHAPTQANDITTLSHTAEARGSIHRIRIPKNRLTYLIRCRDAAMALYYIPRNANGAPQLPAKNDANYIFPFQSFINQVYNPSVRMFMIKRTTPPTDDLAYKLPVLMRPTMTSRTDVQTNVLEPLARIALDTYIGAGLRSESYTKAYNMFQQLFVQNPDGMTFYTQRERGFGQYVNTVTPSASIMFATKLASLYTAGARHIFTVQRVDVPTFFDGVLAYATLRMVDTTYIESTTLRYLYKLALISIGYMETDAANEVSGWCNGVFNVQQRADPLAALNAFRLPLYNGRPGTRQAIIDLLARTTGRAGRMDHADRLFSGNVANGVPTNTLGEGWTPCKIMEVDQNRTLSSVLNIIYGNTNGSAAYLLNNLVSVDFQRVSRDILDWLTIASRAETVHDAKIAGTFLAEMNKRARTYKARALRGLSAMVYAQVVTFDNIWCLPPLRDQDFAREPTVYDEVELPLEGAFSLLLFGISPADNLIRYDGFGAAPGIDNPGLALQYEGCIAEYVLHEAFLAPGSVVLRVSNTLLSDEPCELTNAMEQLWARIFNTSGSASRARFIEYRKRFSTRIGIEDQGRNILVRDLLRSRNYMRVAHTIHDYNYFRQTWFQAPPRFTRPIERATIVTFIESIGPVVMDSTEITHGLAPDHKIYSYELADADDDPFGEGGNYRFLTREEGAILTNFFQDDQQRRNLVNALFDDNRKIIIPAVALREITINSANAFAFTPLPSLTTEQKIAAMKHLRDVQLPRYYRGYNVNNNNRQIPLAGCYESEYDKTFATVTPTQLPDDQYAPQKLVPVETKLNTKRGETIMQVDAIALYYRLIRENEDQADYLTYIHTVPYKTSLKTWLLHAWENRGDVSLSEGSVDLQERTAGNRLYDVATKVYRRENEDIYLGVDLFARDRLSGRPLSDKK